MPWQMPWVAAHEVPTATTGRCFEVLPLMTFTPLSSPLLCCSAQQPRERSWTQSCGGEGGDPSHPEEAQGSRRVSGAKHPPVQLLAVSLHPVPHVLIMLKHWPG